MSGYEPVLSAVASPAMAKSDLSEVIGKTNNF